MRKLSHRESQRLIRFLGVHPSLGYVRKCLAWGLYDLHVKSDEPCETTTVKRAMLIPHALRSVSIFWTQKKDFTAYSKPIANTPAISNLRFRVICKVNITGTGRRKTHISVTRFVMFVKYENATRFKHVPGKAAFQAFWIGRHCKPSPISMVASQRNMKTAVPITNRRNTTVLKMR